MSCIIWKHVAPSLSPCLPAYLNHQWLLRPFLPVLLNQFFTCTHYSPTLWSLGDLSCAHSLQLLLIYGENPHSLLLRLWVENHLLKQSCKMLLGDHLPKTQVIVFYSHIPQKKGWSVAPNSVGLGVKFCISRTLWEMHICMYAHTCTHLSRCKQLCVHLSVIFSDFSFFIWLWIPFCSRPWPLFTSSSLHRYGIRLPAPSLAWKVGLFTTAA